MHRKIIAENYLTWTILVTVLYGVCHSDQPSYQVSLNVHLHPKGPPIHMCNGAIVQSRLILTTAACVHYLFVPNQPVMPIHPSMLTIVAGTANDLIDALTLKVDEVITHDGFNQTTMANDIALLRLSSTLPLGLRDDMKWIIIDGYSKSNQSCLANFYIRNSFDSIPDYTQTEEVNIMENRECLKYAICPEARDPDICSNYILPQDFECKNYQEFTQFSGDRGTGLICRSRLVGLLSALLPFDKNYTNCSERLVKAFYTNLGCYLEWVYEIIDQEERIALSEEEFTASAPYNQEMEAIIISSMFKPTKPGGPDTNASGSSLNPSPEVQPFQGSAANRLGVFSFELIIMLLGLHFLCVRLHIFIL